MQRSGGVGYSEVNTLRSRLDHLARIAEQDMEKAEAVLPEMLRIDERLAVLGCKRGTG